MRLAIMLTVAFVASVLVGCAIFGKIDPNADPFVVNAERSIQSSHSVCRAFLQLDDDNREFVRASLPAAHAFAEQLRAPDPVTGEAKEIAATRQAFEAVQAYKLARTPAAHDDAQSKLMAIEQLATKAQEYITAITAKKAKPAAYWPVETTPAGAFTYYVDSRNIGKVGMIYCCPCGCGQQGSLSFRPLAPDSQRHASWEWDKNEATPTLSPSVHHVGHWHGWLRNGQWEQA